MKKAKHIILIIFTFIFSLLGFGIVWCLTTWTRLSMDELLFELSAPMRGVGSDMLANFFLKCLSPAIVVTALTVILSKMLSSEIKNKLSTYSFLASLVFASITTAVFWKTLDVTDFILNQGDESTFIEEHYIDPETVTISFPEKKRNLVFIYLESMEVTYASIEDGGGFEKGCIPELTELAREGECFSADDTLNGAYVPYGTTWTMGAMFAHSTGLPLKISVDENMMSSQDTFFPHLTAIGDILSKEGYTQELLIGSDGGFGGRRNFYQSHGNYILHDYPYAIEQGIIPEDYKVFWGYEDEKLFENAKTDLLELSKKDEPFNLTLLTVDTHFPDGYVCRLCKDEFGNNQYANVMACSSRQVTEFVRWLQNQDFYDNTTVVICGDHTTMNDQFCRDIPEGYERKKYTAIFNSAVEKVRTDENIQYSSLDMFPTTLAAMGAEIDGEKLGLGVNIYSGEKTLVEEYGIAEINSQFKKKSTFMESLSKMGVDQETLHHNGWLPDGDINVISYNRDADTITINADNIVNVPNLKKIYAVMYDEDMNKLSKNQLQLKTDRSYECDISLKKLPNKKGIIQIIAVGDEEIQIGELTGYLPLQAHDSLASYAKLLQDYDNKAIIMASKGDFTESAMPSDFNVIRELGITQKLYRETKNMYGVVDEPSRYYDESEEPLSYDGVLIGNEVSLHIGSSQEYASIIIDGIEYARDEEGLNVVIYDYDKEEVIDSACFELSYKDRYHVRMKTDVSVEGNKANITVSDVYIRYKVSTAGITLRGMMWDDAHYKKPVEFELQGDGQGTYTGEVNTKGYNTEDIYLELYIYDDTENIEHHALDWHGNLDIFRGTFADFISNLSDKLQSRIIILSSEDDSEKNLTEEDISMLTNMGLSSFLSTEEYGCAYAIITENEIHEDSGIDDIFYEGNYDGVDVVLSNSGWYNEFYSSVIINGEELSRNDAGINVVVYNTETGRVEDSFTYCDNVWIEKDYYRLER